MFGIWNADPIRKKGIVYKTEAISRLQLFKFIQNLVSNLSVRSLIGKCGAPSGGKL
jgi:hypothetical protein